jgi:hypothetical protein
MGARPATRRASGPERPGAVGGAPPDGQSTLEWSILNTILEIRFDPSAKPPSYYIYTAFPSEPWVLFRLARTA